MTILIISLCLWWATGLAFALALCLASKKNPFEVQS